MKGLTLTTREQTRLYIINTVLERRISVAEAAQLLGVSERHTWRLLAAYREEGAAALAHGNRDRLPSNTTSPTVQAQSCSLSPRALSGSEPHAFDGASGGARGNNAISLHSTAPSRACGSTQCSAPAAAVSPLSAGTYASGGDAGADRREPPPLAGRSEDPGSPCFWLWTMPPAPSPTPCFVSKKTLRAISG